MTWFIATITANGNRFEPRLIYASSFRSAFNKAKKRINQLASSWEWREVFLIVDSVTKQKAFAIRAAEKEWRFQIEKGDKKILNLWDKIKDYDELLDVIDWQKMLVSKGIKDEYDLQDEF